MTSAHVSTRRLLPARGGLAGRPARDGAGAPHSEGVGRLRRRGVGRILDVAMDVLVGRFAACVGVTALVSVPFALARTVVLRSDLPELTLLLPMDVVPRYLATAFICTLVGGALVGARTSAGAALFQGLIRLPGMLLLALGTFVASLVLLCPCLVTTFLASWLFSVAPIVYVLEGRAGRPSPVGLRDPGGTTRGWFGGVARAMSRSVRLVSGWGSFGRWAGWFAVANLVVLPIGLLAPLHQTPEVREVLADLGWKGDASDYLLVVLSAVLGSIATAFLAVVTTVYYLDERVRKEGLDLELFLARIRRGSVA